MGHPINPIEEDVTLQQLLDSGIATHFEAIEGITVQVGSSRLFIFGVVLSLLPVVHIGFRYLQLEVEQRLFIHYSCTTTCHCSYRLTRSTTYARRWIT